MGRLVCVLVVVLACSLGIACSLGVAAPAAASTEFWITKGPDAGTELWASGGTGDVSPGNHLNDPSGAIGEVRPDMTFSGSVLGRHVDAPVAPVDHRSPLFRLSRAVTNEQSLLRLYASKSLSALAAIELATQELKGALKDPLVAAVAGGSIRKAIADDGKAATALSEEKAGKLSADAARKLSVTFVKRALTLKAKAFATAAEYLLPQPDETYTVDELGPGHGIGIDANGDVTGYTGSSSARNAFVWYRASFRPLQPLNSGGAGVVVLPGGAVGGQANGEAGVWSPSGVFQAFSTLGGGPSPNNLIRTFHIGLWFGASNTASGVETPTQWTQAGVASTIPGLPALPGSIFGANAKGNLAGTFFQPGGTFSAGALISNNFVNLGDPAGGTLSAGYAINDLNIVYGSAWYPGNTNSTGEIWWANQHVSATTPTQDSYIKDANRFGVGVGGVGTPNQHAPALFYQGHVTDLNTLIPSGTVLHIVIAESINDKGQIAGTAVDQTGTDFAVRLDPKPKARPKRP